MPPRAYVPDTGDVVWLQFDPQAGHEKAGYRPALVISPANYNGKTGLMVCCPMSTKIKHSFSSETPTAVTTPTSGWKPTIFSKRRRYWRNTCVPRTQAIVSPVSSDPSHGMSIHALRARLETHFPASVAQPYRSHDIS